MNPVNRIKSYLEIRNRIQQKSSGSNEVTLVAVGKTQNADAIQELYQQGHRDFGENYAQELLAKAEDLNRRGCRGIRWHFIGHLQTNKVKAVLPFLSAIHSLDSEKLANELAKRWEVLNKPNPLSVFIEVNLDKESSKTGILPENLPALAKLITQLPQLKLEGLMCIPEPGSEVRTRFKQLREILAQLEIPGAKSLSMGMSADFETALEEGATHIRVGTALFGPRLK